MRYKNELSGFVIIDKKGSQSDIDFNMVQFFILRKFKIRALVNMSLISISINFVEHGR